MVRIPIQQLFDFRFGPDRSIDVDGNQYSVEEFRRLLETLAVEVEDDLMNPEPLEILESFEILPHEIENESDYAIIRQEEV